MLNPQTRPAEAGTELLGELHRFAEQLGAPDGLTALGTAALSPEFTAPDSLEAFREFLEAYCTQVLVPHELPAIHKACLHASRHEVRELIASDLQLGHEARLHRFASASRCLGTAQLQKLRPLRDSRVVRRYWEAVEKGEAHGWHTVVYGMILALYSLPLRQGLLNYGEQVIRGFVELGGARFQLTAAQSDDLYARLCEPLPKAVEQILSAHVFQLAS
jgi:urease accessory protein UreF